MTPRSALSNPGPHARLPDLRKFQPGFVLAAPNEFLDRPSALPETVSYSAL
jgi:hypothetical protein